LLETEEASISF